MQINILTPEGNVFSGEGESIQLPGVDGLFEILNDHAPLISALKEGRLRIVSGGNTTSYAVKGGFVEVLRNSVSVLVEGAEAV